MSSTRTGLIWPLTQEARADRVVQRISQAIELGLIPDGEQLPAEAEFAAQLGVSTMTLREALAVLRDAGLVETRRGRTGGTFVRHRAEPPLDEGWNRLRELTVTELRDLLDMQLATEGTAAALAAERAPHMTVRRLQALVEQIAVVEGRGELIRADSRFHIEVAIASQSERLLRSAVDLHSETAPLLWLPSDPAGDHSLVVAEHRAIAAAIADGDGTRARLAAEEHLRHNLARLIELHQRAAGFTPHSTSADQTLPALVTEIRTHVEGFFAGVERVADRVLRLIEEVRREGVPLTSEHLTELAPLIRNTLGGQPMAEGMGVVVAPGLLADRDRYLEWWHHAGERILPLRVNLDPESIDQYDYEQMDWFTVPRDEGRRAIYGPFLDFTGADYYVATATRPLRLDGEFLGVAGVDIRMADFERALMTVLSRTSLDAVLVNGEGSVIASNTSRWVVGSRLNVLPTEEGADFVAVSEIGIDTGWLIGLTARKDVHS